MIPKRSKNLSFDGTRWHTEITFRGRRIRRFAGFTKAQAQATLAKLRAASFDGHLEDMLDPKREDSRTFEGYAQALVDSPAWKQKRSCGRDLSSLENLKGFFRAQQVRLLSDITPERIRAYITKRLDEDGVRPGTVNRETSFLRSVLYVAVQDGLIERNPLASMKGPRARKWKLDEDNSREQTVLEHLTPDAVREIIEAAEPATKPIITIAAVTGMRQAELLKMRPKDLELTAGTIHIPAEHSKSKRDRWIPVDGLIYNTLAGLSRTGETIFLDPATQKAWTQSAFINAFERACAAARIPYGRKGGITFHDLRHFAAFQLVKNTDLITASRILGHADPKMTSRYCHPTEADKRLAIERTSEALFPTRHKDANEIGAPDGSGRTN